MTRFQDELKKKMHAYVKLVYQCTKTFPRDEIYGVTSQFRRAAMSVILNYIEGYARFRDAVKLNFYEISYGSLKESKYLVYFSYTENYCDQKQYEELTKLADEIGKMLWSEIEPLQK
jgi:four helix bundle protein